MPATNFTPILLYRSGTTTNQPTAGNLNQGELAINYADGRLFYKDAAGTPAIQIIGARFGANKTTGETIGAAFGAATGVTGNPGNFVFSAAPSFTGDISTTGTFSATKLIPTGNVTAGNGMYLPTTNTLAFSTDGSERMRIDSSGNVGIGTSSPSRILSIRETENTAVSSSTFWNATYGGLQINNQSTTTNSVTGIGFYGGTSLNSISAIGNVLESTSLGALAFFTGGQGRSSTVPERMRIDSAGNVGIGTSSPAVKLSFGTQFSGNNGYANAIRLYDDGSASTSQTSNSYGFGFIDTGSLSYTSGTGGNHRFFTGNTERMRIDVSGNLLVGTTAAIGAADRLSVSGGNLTVQRTTIQTTLGDNGTSVGYVGTISNNDFMFLTNSTERMRLLSGGQLIINDTTDTLGQGARLHITGGSAQTACSIKIGSNGVPGWYFANESGSKVGDIVINSGSTTYNTSSDYRLKNITGPITTSGEYIDSLNPVEGTWKADGSTFVGLIAHEVQEVSRTTVATGEKDGEEMQGMDYSSAEIIANLIAEVKSLRTRIAALEAK